LIASAADVRDVHDVVRNHITQPEMPESGDFVRIMSLHKSKGLTAPRVMVAGCIQGLVPTVDARLTPAEQARSMNEQRRLFYVAITRCTTALVISSSLRIDRALAMRIGATLRPGWADPAGTIASRFLGELGTSAPAPTTGQTWLSRLQT
jgi:DNA helicase-2/ATP-dependent DNA helicase PcrA